MSGNKEGMFSSWEGLFSRGSAHGFFPLRSRGEEGFDDSQVPRCLIHLTRLRADAHWKTYSQPLWARRLTVAQLGRNLRKREPSLASVDPV